MHYTDNNASIKPQYYYTSTSDYFHWAPTAPAEQAEACTHNSTIQLTDQYLVEVPMLESCVGKQCIH